MTCTHDWRNWPETRLIEQIGLGVPALRYIYHGYAVLPLERGGKKPHRMLPMGGVHNASADAEQVISWWRMDPAANIGVATGRMSGLAVIDLDVKGGHNGMASISSFLHENRLDFPYTALATTPSAGQHYWLRKAGSTAERPGVLPGVDVKGDGGYVVAPPSMRLLSPAGLDTERSEPLPVPYEWVSGCPCSPAEAPGWLDAWLASVPERPVGEGMAEESPDEQAALAKGIQVGSRNRELYRLACSLYRRFGTGPDGAEVVLRRIEAVWLAGSREDMPRREVLTIIESARRFITQQEQAERSMHAASADWRARHGT